MSLAWQLLITLFLLPPIAPDAGDAQSETPDLRRQLAIIADQRDGTKEKSAQLERECLRLLDGTPSPATKGLVYAQIAKLYCDQGLTDPDKVIQYSTKALEFPLDVETTCKVYGCTAGALEAKRRIARGEEAQERTRSLWKTCLEGLDFVLKQNPPANPRELPPVGKFDCSPESSEMCKGLVAKNRREMEERERTLLDNELVFYRDTFLEKCRELYSGRDEGAQAALREIAVRVIANAERAAYVLELIQRKEKPPRDGEER